MTTERKDVLDSAAGQNLVAELAQAMLQRVAPDELALYEETAADYFRDPHGLLQARPREEAVGFGLEIALLTPTVLAIATEAARFLAALVADTARDELREELRPVIASKIKRLLGRDSDMTTETHELKARHPGPAQSLTAEQLRQVRQVAVRQATESGLDDGQATQLADALVGSLIAES